MRPYCKSRGGRWKKRAIRRSQPPIRPPIEISEDYAGPIHLMVTDVVMQGMSGPQLAIHFSALRPEMKVLYVSGYPDDAVHHRVLDPGLAFLQKPFSPRILVQKVCEALGSGSPVPANIPHEN